MRIFCAGDSITAHYDITMFPLTGLGQALELYVKKEIKIHNYAECGKSTKSFIEQGYLAEIEREIREDDFLFIQFGHNDEKEYDPKRYTTPFGTYKENLKIFINTARKAKAIPVLITPLERRCFADAWRLEAGKHVDYVAGMKQVAAEESVALIDLYTKSRAKMEETGETGTIEWFTDNTHLKPDGARIFTSLIAEGLKELGGVYEKLLVVGF